MKGEKCFGVWVSMNMAKSEGWIEKNGSKWKTMPQLMRRYRAASFFTNQFAPEVSMGLRTIEDIQDTEYIDVTDDDSYNDLTSLYEMKKESLSEQERQNAERIINNKETASYKKLHQFLYSK